MREAVHQSSAWKNTLSDAWTHRGPLAWLLWPISLVFGSLAALRRGLYRAGWFKIQSVNVPVIVVGNVVVGGSGKTPVVIALVRHLQARDLRVGVISRGYGRRARDCREVRPDSAVADVGDEPALIQRATAAPVFVAVHRFEAARALLAHYPETQLIICDDGLQHLSLHRDLEICVFDERGIGNGFLLPAGPLREPWPRDMDLVLHTGPHPAFAGFTAQRTLGNYALQADGSQMTLAALAGPGCLSTKPLLALAGIARPEEFFAMLRAQGLTLARTLALPDHYDFNSFSCNEYKAFTVICTEKDAVKLWPQAPTAWAIPLILAPQSAFLNRLDTLLNALLPSEPSPTLSSPHGHSIT